MIGEKVKSLLRGCAAGSSPRYLLGFGPFPGRPRFPSEAFSGTQLLSSEAKPFPSEAQMLLEIIHRSWPLTPPGDVLLIVRVNWPWRLP